MAQTQKRLNDIISFYNILDELEKMMKGKLNLAQCTGKDNWPQRGVYFFFETNQKRQDSGSGIRVTRIGTHALKAGAKTTVWKRLSQHKGVIKSGGGNHRGSIFRLLVGTAIISRDKINCSSWGKGSSSTREIYESEIPLEQIVSKSIREMPFIYLEVPDESGANSLRGYIEKNSISLLSNYKKTPVDSAHYNWLGNSCNREKVRGSGLLNQNHVDETYDPNFLSIFKGLVNDMKEKS
jgi:hypothetical protein